MSILRSISRSVGGHLNPERKRKLRFAQSLWARLTCRRSLSKLATFYHSDKSDGHFYTQHYQRHFAPLRRRSLKILEIGVGGNEDPRDGGASLRMWRDYFPRSTIYGIDLHDKSWHDERRIKTFKGSQDDETFLNDVIKQIGAPDIIIDDGSHRSEHVIKTFNVLFPLLAATGIYAVEDTQTSYWSEYGGNETDVNDETTMMGYFKGLIDGLNVDELRRKDYQPTYFDRHITGMWFYHNLVFIQKGENNEGSSRY